MTPHHPDLGDPEAAAINRHMERPRMIPCDCNREMGDRCAKCAPTNIVPPKVGDRWGDLTPEQRAMVPVGSELSGYGEGGGWSGQPATKAANGRWCIGARDFSDSSMGDGRRITRLGPAPTATPEPDRSGWPVLVKEGRDWWWESGDAAITDCGDGTWSAWPARLTDRLGWFPSADLAAEALCARLPDEAPEQKEAPPLDPRDTEIADLRSQVEAFRRAACVATGWGEDTTPGDSTLLSDLRAMDIKNLRERAESAEATLDAYRIQRDQAREDAAGVRRLLNDAAALRAAAAEACDCDDGEVPADAELARRLRELAREPQDLALVRRVVGIQTAALRKLISEEDPNFLDIAIELAADTIDAAVGVRSDRATGGVATEVVL